MGHGVLRAACAAVLACAACIAWSAGFAPGHALASIPAKPTIGVDGDGVFVLPPSQWNALLCEMTADNVQVVRLDATWEAVQPNAPTSAGPGYDWSWTDKIAGALAACRLRWLPVLDYSTNWSASYSTSGGLLHPKQPDLRSPPLAADYGDYAAYAAAFAKRYGPGGAFWQENPSLTPEPVTEVQIWNEPNTSYFWQPNPNPGAYATLYEDARSAVHAAVPGVLVDTAALANPSWTFLDGMFSAAGAHMALDSVADTPYGGTPADVIDNVVGLRNELDSHGDSTVPIEVSEFGWPTSGSVSWTSTLSDPQRAQALTQTMKLLDTGGYGVGLIEPYTWVSSQASSSDAQDWFGLINANGSATDSSDAFASEAHAIESAKPVARKKASTTHRKAKKKVRRKKRVRKRRRR